MNTVGDYYILTPIDDHKTRYVLDGGQEIYIPKEWDSNLRTRNPQIGIVEGLSAKNELGLSIGDHVYVRHVIFYGDVDKNAGYKVQEHIVHNGKKLFKCPAKHIYFIATEGGDLPEMVGEYILTEEYKEDEYVGSIFVGETRFKNRSRVVVANSKLTDISPNDVLITLPNSLYGVSHQKKDYFRIRESEVVAYYNNKQITPYKNHFVVEDIEDKIKTGLAYLPEKFEHHAAHVKSRVVAKHPTVTELEVGDIVYRNKADAVIVDGKAIINLDQIHFKIQ